MEFTMEILDYFLSQRYSIIHCGNANDKKTFKSVRLWDANENDDEVLYLSFDTGYDAPNVVHIGADNDREVYNRVVCPEGEKISCCNTVLKIFEDFSSWKRTLENEVASNRDVQRILRMSAAFLNLELSIVDKSFHYVAFAAGEQHPAEDKRAVDMELPDVQQLYLGNPDFEDTFHCSGLSLYEKHANKSKRLYFHNFYYRGVYLGRLLMLTDAACDCSGLREMMKYLGENVSVCYCSYYEAQLAGKHGDEAYLKIKEMLDGETLQSNETKQMLAELSWGESDSYQVMYLLPVDGMDSDMMLKYVCVQLENSFEETLAMQYRDGICCVMNLSRRKGKSSYREKLPYMLRDSLCRAGISCEFAGFYELEKYFGQAENALIYGKKRQPALWYYFFSDYSWDYILDKCTQSYPVKDLSHPAIKLLEDYDEKHPGSELVKTLFEYLKTSCNAAQAAQNLFIHRTTFLYRMRRIQKIAALDLEDWNERLRVMFSFSIQRDIHDEL